MSIPIAPAGQTGGDPEAGRRSEPAGDSWIPPFRRVELIEGDGIVDLDNIFASLYTEELAVKYLEFHTDELSADQNQRVRDQIEHSKQYRIRIRRDVAGTPHEAEYDKMKRRYLDREVERLREMSVSIDDIWRRDVAIVFPRDDTSWTTYDPLVGARFDRAHEQSVEIVDRWDWRPNATALVGLIALFESGAALSTNEIAEIHRQLAFYDPNPLVALRQAAAEHKRTNPSRYASYSKLREDFYDTILRLYPERAREISEDKGRRSEQLREIVDYAGDDLANAIRNSRSIELQIDAGFEIIRMRRELLEKIENAGGLEVVAEELERVESIFYLEFLQREFVEVGPVLYSDPEEVDKRELAAAIGLVVQGIKQVYDDTAYKQGFATEYRDNFMWLRRALTQFESNIAPGQNGSVILVGQLKRIDFAVAKQVEEFWGSFDRALFGQEEEPRVQAPRPAPVVSSGPVSKPKQFHEWKPDPPLPPAEIDFGNRKVIIAGLAGWKEVSQEQRADLKGDSVLTALITEMIVSAGEPTFVVQQVAGQHERQRAYVLELPAQADPQNAVVTVTDILTEQHQNSVDGGGNLTTDALRLLQRRLGSTLPHGVIIAASINIRQLKENGAKRPVIVVTFSL